MTLRPEPVTSKFRKEYFDEIYPIRITRQGSLESFGKSTESLVSILYRDPELNTNQNNDELDSVLSDLDTDDFVFFNQYKPKRTSKNLPNNAISREKPGNYYNNSAVSTDKKCKRIIARRPEYPGSRIMEVKYGTVSKTNVSSCPTGKKFNNRKKPEVDNANSASITKRKVVRCTQDNNDKADDETLSYSASSNFEDSVCTDKSLSKKSTQKVKSHNKSSQEVSPRSNDETGDNHEELKSDSTSISKHTNESQSESAQSQRKIQSASTNCSNQIDTDQKKRRKHQKRPKSVSNIPRNAWEMWFMRKEKLRRMKEEERRQKEIKEEEENARLEEEKRIKAEKCREKITEWLQKKEEKRVQLVAEKHSEKEKKQSEETKKEEIKQKSKEKFEKWKQKKLEDKQKEEEKKQKEQEHEEALQMIKKTKAEVAYKEWLKDNRKFQPPVPYSYGISDGKLTSYYDKTSNPPPSFFNPNPWISNTE